MSRPGKEFVTVNYRLGPLVLSLISLLPSFVARIHSYDGPWRPPAPSHR